MIHPMPGDGTASPRSGDPWGRADVEVWLKAAFREMPFTAIYAPRGNTLQSMDRNKPSATFDIVAFSGTVLGDKSDERKVVLIWARATAAREAGDWSIAEFCRERGWNRRTFDRRRIRACERIAAAKNAVDCRYVGNSPPGD